MKIFYKWINGKGAKVYIVLLYKNIVKREFVNSQ